MDKKSSIYESFYCTADQCPITCCQEWKITVDEGTQERWKQTGNTQAGKNLCGFITVKEDTTIISLNQDRKCPFLTEKKLCSLVLEFGDSMLSETCAAFPRQVLAFSDRREYALAACCPEVVDLIKETEQITFPSENSSFLSEVREMLIMLLDSPELSLEKGLMAGFFMLLDLYEKNPEELDTGNRRESRKEQAIPEQFCSPAYLKELSQTVDRMEFQETDTVMERNELFLDLVENYRKENLYRKFLDRTVPAAEGISGEEIRLTEEYLAESRRVVLQPWDEFFVKYLKHEIYGGFLHPDRDFKGSIMAFQWIVLTFAAIQHSIWLLSVKENGEEPEKAAAYENVREAVVILSRMTGYDDEDIEEYLRNSFETEVWDWGYLALLLGNP
ncbi:MAG: flagellin lysine-N-methylase [Lachnospiraceae bacterium]